MPRLNKDTPSIAEQRLDAEHRRDRLDIDTRNDGGPWPDDFDPRCPFKALAVTQREVIPANEDRRAAVSKRVGRANDGNEIALFIEIGEKLQTLISGFFDVALAADKPAANTLWTA